MTAAPPSTEPCQICGADAGFLDAVDFNKSCEDRRGRPLAPSGEAISYYLCPSCGFCFAPAIYKFSPDELARRIYNDDYLAVDPDYAEKRPKTYADYLVKLLPRFRPPLRHLDYGGGSGVLSRRMRAKGWRSTTYDPLVDRDTDPEILRTFDLISAFEVFEHVADIDQLMGRVTARLNPDGIVIFSTLVSDGQIGDGSRLSWWYAAPRNGHISLFSRKSLAHLAEKYRFSVGSFSNEMHILYRTLPDWAGHLPNPGSA